MGAKRGKASRWKQIVIRKQSVRTAVEHTGGEIAHDRLSLDMQITEHLIGLPSAKQTNAISVDVGAQKRHGPGRSKGSGRDVGRTKTKLGAQGGDGQPQDCSEVGGVEARQRMRLRVAEGGQRLRGQRCRLTQVNDAPGGGENGTKTGVAAPAEANDLASDTILLSRELETDKCRGEEVLRRGGQGGESQLANEETDIAELKGLAGRDSTGIFAGPQQKKEGETYHVGTRQREGSAGVEGLCHHMAQDGDRDGLDSVRRVVGLGIACQHAFESEVDIALGSETGVRGPHTRKRLPNAA